MNQRLSAAPANATTRLHPGRLVACGLLLLLFLAPLVFAACNRFEGFSFANESIAYRWGHASRVISGDMPPILPQGFTILAAQEQLVRAIERILPLSAETLRQSVQWFCWGTLGIFIAAFLAILVSLLRTREETVDRILVVYLPWAVALWATGSAGLYYSLLPDYYYLNSLLACATGWRLLPFLSSLRGESRPPPGWAHVWALGLVLGLGVANKVTWGVPCVIAFSAVLLAEPASLGRRLGQGVALAATAALTVILVLLVHYQFSPRMLGQGLTEWLSFMQGQKGEFDVGSPAFYAMVKSYNYDALYILSTLTISAGVVLVTGWRARIFAVSCLLGFVSLLWAAAQRPAGSTLWDVNVLLLLLMSATLLAIAKARRRQWLLAVWIVAIGVLAIRHSPRLNAERVVGTHAASANRFEVFQEITRFAGDRPQFIMLANNEYGHGGVYELLLKAASDFPTWNVSVGRAWLQRFGVDIAFLHEYGTDMKLPPDTSGDCIIWVDRPDLPPLTARHEQLASLARDPGNEVLSLPIFHMMSRPESPKVQVWMHAVRRKTAVPFQRTVSVQLAVPVVVAPLPPQ